MTVILYNMIYTVMAQIMGGFIRLYPLWDKLRILKRSVFIFYGCLFLVDALVYTQLFPRFPQLDVNTFRTVAEIAASIFTFLLVKKCFYRCLFLVCISFIYGLLSMGLANFIDIVALGNIQPPLSFWIRILVIAVCTYALLPLVLRMLRRLLSIWQDDKAPVWKIIWIFPVLFFLLSMLTANIFMGDDAVASGSFLLARLISAAGTVATCLLLARTLKQESTAARLMENARMMDGQLAIQREQFAKLAESAGQEKAARHNLRHHLVALQSFGVAGDIQAINGYLETLIGSLPALHEPWCDNLAVSAVAGHYLSMAESAGVRLDIALDVPADLKQVPDVDLCVVVGNLLENAVEACRRAEGGKFIRVRSDRQGDFLSLLVENSFDGTWQESGGVYYSRKSDGREGIGLSSVRSVCERYDGMLRVEADGRVWRASALLTLGYETF